MTADIILKLIKKRADSLKNAQGQNNFYKITLEAITNKVCLKVIKF